MNRSETEFNLERLGVSFANRYKPFGLSYYIPRDGAYQYGSASARKLYNADNKSVTVMVDRPRLTRLYVARHPGLMCFRLSTVLCRLLYDPVFVVQSV